MLRQIDPQPSIGLSPAKLYLDDIEQIIQILVEAEKERSEERRSDEEVTILFQIHDQTTSDIQDLSRIHPDSTNDFLVEARKGTGFNASVRVYKPHTSWYAWGLTENENWALFHKLEALFEARKLRWKKLLHAHSSVSYRIYGATSVLLFALFSIAFTHFVPRTPVIVAIAILATLFISLRTGLSSHSIVIFRHRADHAIRGQEGAMKAVLEISKLIIGFILGVLTLYLKHKYWP
jgi:hypothetical protein